jgi:YbaB/EbfC DNA-binding family
MDINKMMQQVQQMQAEVMKAQEELAKETVEASAGGGMVTVTATGSGEIQKIARRTTSPSRASAAWPAGWACRASSERHHPRSARRR